MIQEQCRYDSQCRVSPVQVTRAAWLCWVIWVMLWLLQTAGHWPMLGHQFLRVVMLVTCYVTQTADSDMRLSLCLPLLEPNQAFYQVKAN